jgi:hypothetical protein
MAVALRRGNHLCKKKRKKAAVYKTRPIMPRAGATGDKGGAAGGKARSTEAQTSTTVNTRGSNIALDLNLSGQNPREFFYCSLDVDSKLFSKVQMDAKRGLG